MAVVAVVVGALLASGCSAVGDDADARSTPSAEADAADDSYLPPTPVPVTPSPTTQPDPGPDPLLRAAYPELGYQSFITRFGPRTVIASDAVVGLDRDGEEVWQVPVPAGKRDDAEVARVGRVVTLTYDIEGQAWPGLERLTVIDGRSGEVLWRDETASFVSSTDEALFTSVCTGEQESTLGDCTLSSRDPRTGDVLWSQPTYASSSVEDDEDGLVLVHSYPEGNPGVVQVHDLATGEPVSTTVDARGYVALAGRALVSSGPGDDVDRDGCRQAAFAVDFAGDRLWRRVLRVGRDTLDPGECFEMYVEAGDDGLVTLSWYEGVPTVVDAATGETVWRGERGERTPVVSRRTIVAVQAQGGFAQGVRVVTPRGGDVRWTAPEGTGDLWLVDDDRLIAADVNCYDPCKTVVFAADDGRRVAVYDGYYAGHGPGWLATVAEPGFQEVDYAVYPTRSR
ncbi:hypothetical protein GCM10023340_35370 [Nocardioides marinquilinus]|uniref:Pyrrolo-quinoline quinone repeat domain-containing protein n=2 Tax=Nocardioides marinquilinus TaxID=1210400 RepID=A0ABP9PZL1_9ACTN